jgi:hypothetical protein
MKFKDIFDKAARQYLTEQQADEMMAEDPSVEQSQPTEVLDTELPTEETIDLNEEKYKALLLMVQKALIMAYKNDTDKRNNLSDLEKKIETEPKEAEKTLQSFLDSTQSNFPENSF